MKLRLKKNTENQQNKTFFEKVKKIHKPLARLPKRKLNKYNQKQNRT